MVTGDCPPFSYPRLPGTYICCDWCDSTAPNRCLMYYFVSCYIIICFVGALYEKVPAVFFSVFFFVYRFFYWWATVACRPVNAVIQGRDVTFRKNCEKDKDIWVRSPQLSCFLFSWAQGSAQQQQQQQQQTVLRCSSNFRRSFANSSLQDLALQRPRKT